MQLKAVALRALGPLVGEIPAAARRRRIPAALAGGRHGATAQRETARPPRPATLAASFPASPSLDARSAVGRRLRRAPAARVRNAFFWVG
jgi:hypothetical protein